MCVGFCACVSVRMSRWSWLFVCVCVCEVRLGCRLLLWFSGNARGVCVTFSPSLSSICWARGSALPGHLCWLLEQRWALSMPVWGRRGRWRPGQLSRCWNSAGPGSGLSKGGDDLLRQAWEEGKSLFVWKTTDTRTHSHDNYNFALLKDKYTHSSMYTTASVGAVPSIVLLSIKFE